MRQALTKSNPLLIAATRPPESEHTSAPESSACPRNAKRGVGRRADCEEPGPKIVCDGVQHVEYVNGPVEVKRCNPALVQPCNHYVSTSGNSNSTPSLNRHGYTAQR